MTNPLHSPRSSPLRPCSGQRLTAETCSGMIGRAPDGLEHRLATPPFSEHSKDLTATWINPTPPSMCFGGGRLTQTQVIASAESRRHRSANPGIRASPSLIDLITCFDDGRFRRD